MDRLDIANVLQPFGEPARGRTRFRFPSSSRREVMVRLAAGLAAALPFAFSAEKAKGKKKKRKRKKKCKCPLCQQCLGGRCIRAPEGTPCRDCGRCYVGVCAIPLGQADIACGPCATCGSGGICVPKANNILCEDTGRCLNGTCKPQPICDPAGTFPCFGGSAADCCSGQCCSETGFTFCCQSQLNERCFGDGDCDTGLSCVGYRCL